MKTFFMVSCYILFVVSGFSKSNLDYYSTILEVEENPYLSIDAREKAIERNLPVSIVIQDEVVAQPVIIKNDDVLFSVVTNIAHPYNGGYLATFNELERTYDLNKAQIRYYGEKKLYDINSKHLKLAIGDSLYLIPESTNDRVMAFDAGTGDLIDADFVPAQGVLSTPIEAQYHSLLNSFIVSDQLLDIVQEFDTSGAYLGTFAPKGGQATDTLDNVRGIGFHPNGNLLVSTASGTNSDAIVEFDLLGNFVRNFVTPNASIMDSPFDVLARTNDILVPALTNEVVARYDSSGTYLDYFATSIDFPEQIAELRSGEIAVANFGVANAGIQIYPATGGSFTQLLAGVTGNRGVSELANGNLLTTNGSGVHEIDRTTGALVRTIQSGVSARFISLYVVNQQPALPLFNLSEMNIDFGTVQKDSSKTDTLFVHNSGNAELLISSVISDNSDFVVIPDTGMIAINDSLMFEVTFTAGSDSGNQNGNIVFTHNAQSSPDTLYVTANIVTGLERSEFLTPKTFRLSQNFPNPFNPSTNIKFSLPVSEYVKFTIFNIKGEEINSLIEKNLQAGEYNLKFNASSLPSGVYIYEIRAGNFKQSHKMILLK